GADASITIRPRTILHCHGNGENIAQVGAFTAKQFSQVLQANVFIFDYRGFGKSEGSPYEAGVKEDADAALAWLCEKDGVKPADVVIVGHSLGGGLACYLAKKHGCKALILQRTFSSLPDAAARKYWMFPVRLIMRNRLNSAETIKSCDVPLFQSHGEKDTLIPIDLGRKLFDNSPSSKKKFFPVSGMSHWDPLPQQYWVELKAFIEEVDPREPVEVKP
ncbi:alpha/beta hydrolase, partial [Mariniblastus sp.]|nr:alpha/beta hydrolase [Mariniblastus sp.]